MGTLEKKVIWLTGASSGIGETLALELARRGALLAITARRRELLDGLVSRIAGEGGSAIALAGDVLDLDAMKNLSGEIAERLGVIDILVANAGTHIETRPESFDSSEYLSLMDINYGGMLRCIEAVLPSMLERGSGHVVGVASLAGMRGLPRAAAYGASKAAMIHFLESLRFHVKARGVKVTVVNPGFVKTPLTDKNDFYMPFLTSPERAAAVISRGIENQRREISFPFPFNWIVKSGRFMPASIYEMFVDRMW
jgi:short-subunit dehydrogenase